MGKAGDGLVSLAQQKSESVVRIQAQTAPIESVEIYMIHEAHIWSDLGNRHPDKIGLFNYIKSKNPLIVVQMFVMALLSGTVTRFMAYEIQEPHRSILSWLSWHIPIHAFRVGSFNSLPVEDGTADLVTVSQAVHWFTPIESFYKEVDRALKPGGCLAVYEYGNERFPEQYQERISSFIQEVSIHCLNSGRSPGQHSWTMASCISSVTYLT